MTKMKQKRRDFTPVMLNARSRRVRFEARRRFARRCDRRGAEDSRPQRVEPSEDVWRISGAPVSVCVQTIE